MRTLLIPELVRELCVLGTGIDDNDALEAWITVKIDQLPADNEVKQAIERANAHWQACSEDLKSAIGPFFGLGAPHNEEWPTLNKIKADYEVYVSFVLAIIDEPHE